MERTEWLKQIRNKTQALYDHISPKYWEKYGIWISETHVRYLLKFLGQLPPHSRLLSAGCGAGLYDGILAESGHSVVGIDLSSGMLNRARQRNTGVQYEQIGLQDINYHSEFDGIICIDALEHVYPEDWPVIVHGFRKALKPGGVLYLTVDVSASEDLQAEYEKAKALGLPAVYGEVVADVDESFGKVMAMDLGDVPGEAEDRAVYHYYPALEQVREWLAQENFVIEAEEMGIIWYRHFLARKVV